MKIIWHQGMYKCCADPPRSPRMYTNRCPPHFCRSRAFLSRLSLEGPARSSSDLSGSTNRSTAVKESAPSEMLRLGLFLNDHEELLVLKANKLNLREMLIYMCRAVMKWPALKKFYTDIPKLLKKLALYKNGGVHISGLTFWTPGKWDVRLNSDRGTCSGKSHTKRSRLEVYYLVCWTGDMWMEEQGK